jgi:hypothetical protein
VTTLAADPHAEVLRRAQALITSMAADPWGGVSPSVYETARVVSLAPDLPGHAARRRFLQDAQHPGGWWGGPDGYALVPTLSATEALLRCLAADPSSDRSGRMAAAAARGLRALWRRSGPLVGEPDTPARDLIVPALTEAIHHLTGEALPYGDTGRLAGVRAALAEGHRPPAKLAHVWEIVAATGPSSPPPHPLTGLLSGASVGASPAAAAACLSGDAGDDVRRYLVAAIDRYDGPLPCATPVVVFVRAWTLSWLARAGVVPDGLTGLLTSLTAEFGPTGTAAGPGLPPDADTTAVVLDTLARLGRPRAPDCLWPYDLGSHFCTWPGEDGASPTVNAHVLDAFGSYLRASSSREARYADAVRRITSWLCDQQRPDGAWDDRWHTSPYYATACCALALAEFGGLQARSAVGRAIDWVTRTQHDDGSWGRWDGTAEETAYALHVLALAKTPEATAAAGGDALTRGRRFLAVAQHNEHQPALWHDKDLYRPDSIVTAVTLAALHRTARIPIPPGRSGGR